MPASTALGAFARRIARQGHGFRLPRACKPTPARHRPSSQHAAAAADLPLWVKIFAVGEGLKFFNWVVQSLSSGDKSGSFVEKVRPEKEVPKAALCEEVQEELHSLHKV